MDLSEFFMYIPMGPIRMPENYFFDRFALRGTLGGLNDKNRHFSHKTVFFSKTL